MSTVVRFPGGRKHTAARPIPREEFERLAELALDVVDRIVEILNDQDGDPDREDGEDAEPSLAAPEGHESQVGWCRGGDADREADGREAALPEVGVEPSAAIVIPPLRWGGAGNVVAAAGVLLFDLLEYG